jgi:hypothetical protein
MLAAACALLASSPLWAAPLKVDISNSGRPISEGLDPAFTNWGGAVQNWFTGGNSTSATFSDVTVTFTRVGPNGAGLKTGYWKDGVQNTAYNVKLTGDGLMVDGGNSSAIPPIPSGEAGAQIEMRIAGLTPGSHSLLLYLNSWDGILAPNVAPLDIFVGAAQTQVFDNLPVSVRVTDNNLATTAYFPVTAVAGQDVIVLIKADTGGTHSSKNVHVNGFEIDVPNVKAQANNPSPAHADEHANADSGSITLSWGTAVLGATSHDVYLGTSESAVANATAASPEFKGNQTANSYLASGINPHLTYYWRVDEVTATGSTKGNVWMFRPRRLAFPGAEGYGRFARGGRGGVVVKVTNLNDSGPGSLRDAITGNYGPRTVVFDVSGLITLESDIILGSAQPYITIAGQTAPGKGICVKKQQLAMSGARDVIFRYLRVLVGKESGETQNATGMAGVDHCIMDHCSLGWGIDEGLSTRGGKNLTFQRNSLSEALNIAGHQNYGAGTRHGYAASVGGDIASLHHNLLAHNEGRNWSMAGGLDGAGYYAGKLDIFNNVVYNWRSRTTDGGAHQVNFVANYYKTGAATTLFTALNPQYGSFPGTQQYYMAGNVMPGRFTEANQSAGLNIGTESGGTLPQNSNPPYSAMVNAPFFPSHATIHNATGAYKQVTSDVGCNLPQIDARDTRIIGETLAGTYTYRGSISNSPGLPDTTADVGGWENYGNETRPAGFDTDNDGMPDWWETIKGLSPTSPTGDFAECNADPDGDGYTNLEDYLNWKAAPNHEVNSGASIDIDLHALARGYLSTTPVFTFSGQTNGTVALVSGRYARFTPSTSANALGGFSFTVTDSAGDSMTRPVGIRIVAAAVVLPEVTIAATDASAGESGADQQLRFTLTRTGSTASPLSVPLVPSGSASSGADYSGFASPVTIPAGQASSDLTLTVLADVEAEGSEGVTLSLGSDPAFTAGTPASASASIADKPAQAYYVAVIADPAQRGSADDPDGDSVPNLIEYFQGSDPASASRGGLHVAAGDMNGFTVSFPRALNRPDVIGSLQWSTDLSTWFASGQSDGTRTVTFSETVTSAPGADPETVEADATITGGLGSTPRVFVRLRVE